MCGVIGIIDKEQQVSERLYLGMLSLQHRGQDAAGIVTCSENGVSSKKGPGRVQEIFSSVDMDSLKGDMGIGHTRYPTIGIMSKDDVQPFFVDSSQRIAMAHNGNVTNYFGLKSELRKKGVFLGSSVDVEPILQIFAGEYEQDSDFERSAGAVIERVRGAYSVVGLIGGLGLFAIRDPHGIRPLVLGKKEGSVMLASETVVLQSLGYEYVRDIQPGEALLITKDLSEKSFQFPQKRRAHCMFEWVYFARPDSIIEQKEVYRARLELGRALAKRIDREKIDVVIPVPDTARTAAIKLADETGIRYREGLIKNRYIGRTFIMPGQKSRENAVMVKLNPVESAVRGKRVAVVDDSIVRGTTSRRIIDTLRKAGPEKIIFISTCPPVVNPCYYGVDFPRKEELIASSKSVEEICRHIGADEVIYQSLEDLKSAIGVPLCTACVEGDYPEPLSDEQKNELNADSSNRC